jgi:hypothetical protein
MRPILAAGQVIVWIRRGTGMRLVNNPDKLAPG